MRLAIEVLVFIFSMFAAFGVLFKYFDDQYTKINEQISLCLTKKDIESLEASVEKIELWVEGDINDSTKPGANSRLEKIENTLKILAINVDDSIAMNNLIYTTSMENRTAAEPVSYDAETHLGKDSAGNDYDLGDVAGESVLLTYNENGKEVYFFGKLNKKFNWDGYCITNTYNNDGTLYGICESNFIDGKRIDYESFYLSSIEDEWIHTKRICKKDGNLGISERYNFQYNKVKNFTNTNVRIYDLLYIKDFSNLNDKTMLTYYSGYTLEGEYNDQTKNYQNSSNPPYEIIFNDDGTIKILYIGQFVDGQFNDQTGYAQEIVFDSYQGINKYFYYQGTFTGGERDGEVSSSNYVTLSEIDKILENIEFDIELNWYKEFPVCPLKTH